MSLLQSGANILSHNRTRLILEQAMLLAAQLNLLPSLTIASINSTKLSAPSYFPLRPPLLLSTLYRQKTKIPKSLIRNSASTNGEPSSKVTKLTRKIVYMETLFLEATSGEILCSSNSSEEYNERECSESSVEVVLVLLYDYRDVDRRGKLYEVAGEGQRSEEAGSIFISFSLFLPNLETLNCPFIDHYFNPFIITYTPWAFCLVATDPNPSCQHSILHSKHCLFLSSLPSFARAVRVKFVLLLHG